MKKLIPPLIAACALLAFAACDKDKESNDNGSLSPISGVIQNMPTDAGQYVLKAIIYLNDGIDGLTVAECNVAANGSFSLALPETVNSDQLKSVNEVLFIGMDILINNPNAEIGFLKIELYGDGEYIDKIVYVTFSVSTALAEVIWARPYYSDSDFTFTGSWNTGPVNMTVNVVSTEGWNWMVQTSREQSAKISYTYNSKLPGGLKWFLYDDIKDALAIWEPRGMTM